MRFTRGAVINCKKLFQTNSKEFFPITYLCRWHLRHSRSLGYFRCHCFRALAMRGLIKNKTSTIFEGTTSLVWSSTRQSSTTSSSTSTSSTTSVSSTTSSANLDLAQHSSALRRDLRLQQRFRTIKCFASLQRLVYTRASTSTVPRHSPTSSANCNGSRHASWMSTGLEHRSLAGHAGASQRINNTSAVSAVGCGPESEQCLSLTTGSSANGCGA